jgi:hypothetical protein
MGEEHLSRSVRLGRESHWNMPEEDAKARDVRTTQVLEIY